MPILEISDIDYLIKEYKKTNVPEIINDYYRNYNNNRKNLYLYKYKNLNDDKILSVLCSLFNTRNLEIEKKLFENNKNNYNLQRIYHSINDENINDDTEQERHKDINKSYFDANQINKIINKDNDIILKIDDIYKRILVSDFHKILKIKNNLSNINLNQERRDIKLIWKDSSCYINSVLVALFHDGFKQLEQDLNSIINEDDIMEYNKVFKIVEILQPNMYSDYLRLLKNIKNELLNIYKKIKESNDTNPFNSDKLRDALERYYRMVIEPNHFKTSINIDDYKYEDTNPNFNLINKEGETSEITNFIFNKILKEYDLYNHNQINDLNTKDTTNYDKKTLLRIEIYYRQTSYYENSIKNINYENLSSFIIYKGTGHYISIIKYNNDWYTYNDVEYNNNNKGLTKIDLSQNENDIKVYLINFLATNQTYKITNVVYSTDNYKDYKNDSNNINSIVCFNSNFETICLYKHNNNYYEYNSRNYDNYNITTNLIQDISISNYKPPYYLIYK